MSEWIRIRVKDFYKDAIGETEYTYVTEEVYEALTETFRKEVHAQQMRDLRHVTREGYTEGETEDLIFESGESLEDMVIRQMELETLQKANHMPHAVCIRLRICTLTNAGADTLISASESSTRSRCVLPAISSSPDTLAI